MAETTTQQQTAIPEEMILVVPRTTLIPEQAGWSGIKAVDADDWLRTVQENRQFLPRSVMETDPSYKQIIPYLVFEHENRYFLMQRTATATERRLQSKYSLGIGGHIRQEDMADDSIFAWARREFHEEVAYADELTIEPLGILNDDSNDVGKVHLGFVLLLHGSTSNIKVKSELKSGVLLPLEECADFYDRMESWSRMVFDFLRTRK